MAAAVLSCSSRALNRATLARQMLLAREDVSALRAVERLGGLQAQWPKPPFIGLWSRIDRFKREDLARLLARRAAVRATMMRGTLHIVSARDYASLRPALQPMLTKGMQRILRDRASRLDIDALIVEARSFLARKPRTFIEVRDHLMKHHPRSDERAMGYAVRMTLPLVQVPEDERWGFATTAHFALAESWLGRPLEVGVDLEMLVLRYLAAFGPATPGDVQTWSGLQGLREVVERLRPRLRVLRDERGRELFDLPRAPRPSEDTAAPVRFLPEFDNVLLAHDDRSRVIADAHRRFVFLPGLRVAATFLVDGLVAGTWKVEHTAKAVGLVVEPFEALSGETRAALADEGASLLRFVEADAQRADVRIARARIGQRRT